MAIISIQQENAHSAFVLPLNSPRNCKAVSWHITKGETIMMGQTERVILIKGDGTKWYNQAIFIVNQDNLKDNMPMDFVAEAERIINNYMIRNKKNAPLSLSGGNLSTAPVAVTTSPKPAKAAVRPVKKKTSKVDFVLNFLMVMACMAIVAVFVYGMLG